MNDSGITADGDGHADRQGHEQEASGIPHEDPPTITSESKPAQGYARVVGVTPEGDYILSFKRKAHSDGQIIIKLTQDAAKEFLTNLFKAIC